MIATEEEEGQGRGHQEETEIATETDAQGQEVLIEDEGIDHLTEGDEEGQEHHHQSAKR